VVPLEVHGISVLLGDKCRREDSTGPILPRVALSVTSYPIWLSSISSCCVVQEKLSRGGAFVSYSLAVGVRYPCTEWGLVRSSGWVLAPPASPNIAFHSPVAAKAVPRHTWPRPTLLVKSRGLISDAIGVRFHQRHDLGLSDLQIGVSADRLYRFGQIMALGRMALS
jgi:hypothetical protein